VATACLDWTANEAELYAFRPRPATPAFSSTRLHDDSNGGTTPPEGGRSCTNSSGRIPASRRCPRSSMRGPSATRSSSRKWCSRWWRAVSWREALSRRR